MIVLPGYQITEEILSGASTIIYRGIRERDRLPVIVKILKSEYPTLSELSRLRQEYNITQSLSCQGIVKTYSLETYQNGYALILEDVIGQSLLQLFNAQKLPFRELLRIAIALADVLDELHQVPIIHKDIKPSNIIVNHETGQIKLSDFGIASRLEITYSTIRNPNLLEGTLAYMSPEQTGRMNRAIDYRSDFYALGATLYEMLTGRVPFTAVDPMELVHCHLAKQPVPPQELPDNDREIPEAVSDIVMKLLAKNAEDRYQSAAGLKYDLEACLHQLQTTGKIADFSVGTRDRSGQLHIPQKLYGRETEVAALMEAFDRVGNGAAEMMLVSGYSGIGKTAIVNEVHKPIVKARGYFIAGKFDQFKRNIPYAALIQAFSALIDQLLTESTQQVETWKTKLLSALGSNGQAIVEVIPDIELIIGEQPDIPQLGPSEAENRFNRVFQQFIHVFCQPEHPLVIFLDDLQWADSASLKLIQLLMSDPDSCYLLAIGAYRDNEVSPTHPLIQTIEKIRETGAVANDLIIGALEKEQVCQLVADTLGQTDEQSEPLKDSASAKRPSHRQERQGIFGLSELLFNKTQGNPFFLTQLLKTLYAENLLKYDAGTDSWQWDISQIQALGITDYSVVELIARNIQKLPESTQQVLKLAACIGNHFNLDVLAIANAESTTVTAAQLWAALQVGLILPTSDSYKIPLVFRTGSDMNGAEEPQTRTVSDVKVDYKFLHDRVQQAAYSLIEEPEKKATHLRIGQLLLEKIAPEEQKDNIFALVNQLNYGCDLLETQQRKDWLAELNLQAGQKAKASAAYEASLNYLNIGLELLANDSWQSNYDLTIGLYIEAVEAQYLNSNFEQSGLVAEVGLSQAKTLLDKVKIYELKIQSYIARNQMEDAIELSQKVLKMLEIKLQQEPPIELMLDRLENLPEMTDPNKIAVMRLLKIFSDAAYVAKPELYAVIVFTQVDICMNYGNCPLSAIAYIDYALILCSFLGNIELGYRFGNLALTVLEKHKAVGFISIVTEVFNSHVRQWREPIISTIEPLKEAVYKGLENGELLFSGYAAINYCTHSFCIGEHLESVEYKTKQYIELLTNIKLEYHAVGLKINHQILHNLLARTPSACELSGPAFNELEMLPILQEYNNFTALFWVYVFKAFIVYLFKEHRQAVESAKLAEEYVTAVPALLVVAEHNFYYSLALLGAYPNADETEQKLYLEKVAANQKKMKNWAEHAPSNFLNKYELVEAEKARVLDDRIEATNHYDRAIKEAKEQGFTHEEALANELAGEFYLERDRESIGRFYIIEAYYGYIRWGAIAKVKDLESRYPAYLARIAAQKPPEIDLTQLSTTTTTMETSGLLDLPTVMKASQAISGEIVLSKLLEKLVKIAIENAGAQTGKLILMRDGKPVVEATGEVAGGKITVRRSPSTPLEEAAPTTALNYVQRAKSSIVLLNATKEGSYTNDPYILKTQPKSVLCTPIVQQRKLIGIVYLENNLAPGVFTPDRLELLKMLSGQAAIALENATLYANLEQSNEQLATANHQLEDYNRNLEKKVTERTIALQEKNKHLNKTLEQLQRTQSQLIQTEKMSSLGQMVAGIAHEINNPNNFIVGNIRHAKEYLEDLLALMALYDRYCPDKIAEIQQRREDVDFEFIKYDLPELLESMIAGSNRIRDIVLSLRNFAHLDEADMKRVDIHSGLNSTLLILQHRLNPEDPAGQPSTSPKIQVIQDYGQLPKVECYAGQLNQVFMNILTNAIDSLEIELKNKVEEPSPAEIPTIWISTKAIGKEAIGIRIADNGPGMASSVCSKLFDPFFTTKPVGSGTGLGLFVSYQIIVEKHHGKLKCNSQPGKGAEFVIEIPVTQPITSKPVVSGE